MTSKGFWFGARLIYAVGWPDKHRVFLVHDDHWLFRAPTAERAFKEALNGAKAAERMGRALLSYVAGVVSKRADARRQLSGSFTRHDFLGFADFHLVGARLRQGTEVDLYLLEPRPKRRPKVPSKKALLAFDPAGPAFRGKTRAIQNTKLFERYKWYLSDALYDPPANRAQSTGLNGRMVLIKADGPGEAYDLAQEKAASIRSLHLGDFVGINQLSLVTNGFEHACLLRTDEYTIDPTNLADLIQPKSQLLAFRRRGHEKTPLTKG